MSKRYLDNNNHAPSLPFMPMLWTAAAFKIFNAPEWLWGVFGVVWFFAFVVAIYKIVAYEKVEL